MQLWRFRDPRDERYAVASRRGRWQELEDGSEERVPPMLLEWEEGSNVIGDFTWPGFSDDMVVKADVAKSLKQHVTGFELTPVEIIKDRRQKLPKGLPESGEGLSEVWVTLWVNADPELTTTEGGGDEMRPVGVEMEKSRWDKKAKVLIPIHIPRENGKGIFVPSTALSRPSIFRVTEFPGWIFCTNTVREFILEKGFTNVSFLEMGETC